MPDELAVAAMNDLRKAAGLFGNMLVPQKTSVARSAAPAVGGNRAPAARDLLVGFLTIVERPEAGYFGGYLVLNAAGRPVEFHCSAPLRANRAQEILYGPTLRPYLCGELIAATLLSKAKSKAAFVCTDCEDVIPARGGIAFPLVLVADSEDGHVPTEDTGLQFSHGGVQVLAAAEFQADRAIVQARLQTLGEAFDLREPFERIRLAIDEAQRGVQR